MKMLADTSCMVALLVEDHPAHARVLPYLQRVVRGEVRGVLAAHTLAETYSVLTRMPHTPPIRPEVAWQAIERNLPHFEVVALTEEEYKSVLSELAGRGIGGGPTYD